VAVSSILILNARPHPNDYEGGISWAEWKAAELNRLFQERDTSGQPGRITAATVLHGEKSQGKARPNERI
jgi:hypothetical protein